jgi:hypothetical protein
MSKHDDDELHEVFTKGALDPRDVASLENQWVTVPSLGFVLGFMISYMIINLVWLVIISFIPDLFGLTVNKFFWVKWILDVIIHAIAMALVVYNLRYVWGGWIKGSSFAPGPATRDAYRGTGSALFLVCILFGVLALGYLIMYLIWGGIDTSRYLTGSVKTWGWVLFGIMVLDAVLLIGFFIALGVFLRRLYLPYIFYSRYGEASSSARFVCKNFDKETAAKWMSSNFTHAGLTALASMTNRSTGNSFFRTRSNWSNNDVLFTDKYSTSGGVNLVID